MKGNYPSSPSGQYHIKDSIGVPHPYMITGRHVSFTSDHHMGILDKSAMEDCENHGIRCGICKGKLSLAEHEQALLVSCPAEGVREEDKAEVQDWLKSLLPEVEANGYAGFSFMKRS